MSSTQTNKSEVAQFRQQQALEEESAQRALNGLAQVGGHDFIVNKFSFDTEKVLQLFKEGKNAEAEALWDSLEW